ncbi:MAG: hypothetical protein IPI28_18045 [Candidatus Omnitrophica bacterium]|nr:hypothetical protein [Candidatus Omnitrophota bacterium]
MGPRFWIRIMHRLEGCLESLIRHLTNLVENLLPAVKRLLYSFSETAFFAGDARMPEVLNKDPTLVEDILHRDRKAPRGAEVKDCTVGFQRAWPRYRPHQCFGL